MIPRGEVGLIFAQMGLSSGVFDAKLFSAVTLMVMVTTFLAPPLLRVLFPPRRPGLGPAGSGRHRGAGHGRMSLDQPGERHRPWPRFPTWTSPARSHKADPYPFYARLRAEAPVHRVTLPDRQTAWLVTRYDDVAAALKDERFAKDKASRPDPRSRPPSSPGSRACSGR